jgi:hypothetical protein
MRRVSPHMTVIEAARLKERIKHERALKWKPSPLTKPDVQLAKAVGSHQVLRVVARPA